jgi:hypothetical protein
MIGLTLSLWVQPSVTAGNPPPAFTPSLDFSDTRNSGYAPVLGF